MAHRQLSVTAYTTLDHVDARAVGPGWAEHGRGVLDVESPDGVDGVRLGLEFDTEGVARLEPHADYATLTPEQARTLAAELREVADAAEEGDTVTSGRG